MNAVATHGRGMWTIPVPPPLHVYYGTYNQGMGVTNQIYALDAASGSVTWSYLTSTSNGSTILANGVVYVAGQSGGGLYALNAASGSLTWHYLFSGSIYGLTVTGGLVYFGGSDGYLYALNANTGALVWKTCLCKTRGGPFAVGTPTVVGGTVYVVGDLTYVYALNASTGAVTWAYNSKLEIGGPDHVVYANGILYTPANTTGTTITYSMLAVNATTGRLVWSYQYLSAQGISYQLGEAAVANGVVYFDSNDWHLLALNASTGVVVWIVNLGNTACPTGGLGNTDNAPVIANGTLYMGVQTEIDVFNSSNGAALWYYLPCSPGYGGYTSPVVVNGIGYFAAGGRGSWRST